MCTCTRTDVNLYIGRQQNWLIHWWTRVIQTRPSDKSNICCKQPKLYAKVCDAAIALAAPCHTTILILFDLFVCVAFPEQDWLHLVGFIHDLGKVIGTPALYNDPQWYLIVLFIISNWKHDNLTIIFFFCEILGVLSVTHFLLVVHMHQK